MASGFILKGLYGSFAGDLEDAKSWTFFYNNDVKETSGLQAEGKLPSALVRAVSRRRRPLRRESRR